MRCLLERGRGPAREGWWAELVLTALPILELVVLACDARVDVDLLASGRGGGEKGNLEVLSDALEDAATATAAAAVRRFGTAEYRRRRVGAPVCSLCAISSTELVPSRWLSDDDGVVLLVHLVEIGRDVEAAGWSRMVPQVHTQVEYAVLLLLLLLVATMYSEALASLLCIVLLLLLQTLALLQRVNGWQGCERRLDDCIRV